ncbi:hypothetical protein ACLOJK_038630 [Asimina triloba]
MIGPASAGPLEGIFIAVGGSNLARPVSTDILLSPEGTSRPLFLEGGSQVIDLEEEGGPAPSVSIGDPKLFAPKRPKLEAVKGDVSLLHKQVAFLGSREAKLLS